MYCIKNIVYNIILYICVFFYMFNTTKYHKWARTNFKKK